MTSNGSPGEKAPGRESFQELLTKTIRLKEFAVKNGYQVDEKTLEGLNDLQSKLGETQSSSSPAATDRTTLDNVIQALTSVTLPTTIDSLSGKEGESEEYKRFKKLLTKLGWYALALAVAGFSFSAASAKWNIPLLKGFGNSVLAIGLGLLGAIVYSLFNVLRVVPPQAFCSKDEYSNKARLLLGVLLGWVFYFAFCMKAYDKLPEPTSTQTFMLLVPFVAGYSTKFVVGVLERAIAALEITLGIEEKRDVGTKRLMSRRGLQ